MNRAYCEKTNTASYISVHLHNAQHITNPYKSQVINTIKYVHNPEQPKPNHTISTTDRSSNHQGLLLDVLLHELVTEVCRLRSTMAIKHSKVHDVVGHL